MPHRDLCESFDGLQGSCLQSAIRWLLAGIDWSSVRFRNDCSWAPQFLAITAVFWVWAPEPTLLERFEVARRIVGELFCPQQELATSYQAFMKMLLRWSGPLIQLLVGRVRSRIKEMECWEVDDVLMFGVDGSKIDLARTTSNEAAYAPSRSKRKGRKGQRRKKAKKSKKNDKPQLLLTTLWHAGSGLPWAWRRGASDESERHEFLAMLATLPPESLIAGDAGFVGYELARQILVSGRQLLLRVGSNTHLLRDLGYARESNSIVYLWPNEVARRQKHPPLVLRLVVVHNGKHPVYLLTSVLSSKVMSDRQVAKLYQRRWGIEIFYRHFKHTFGRRKLRSCKAENALVEIDWALIGLTCMALYTLVELLKRGVTAKRLSVATMLKLFRATLRDYRHPVERDGKLRRRLGSAMIDDRNRTSSKTARATYQKKQERPPGAPKITTATEKQRNQARQFRQTQQKIRLTA